MKTIITASVSTKTAAKLQDVNKGNRSRVVDRAINEYLDGRKAFNIHDIQTKRLATVLMSRLQEANNWNHTPLSLGLKELIETISDEF
ncbi:MAG: hypothetical protein VW270_23925 [Candidatus Poseidoniales archaeon]